MPAVFVSSDGDHDISAVSAGGRSIFAVFAADYRRILSAGFLNPEADTIFLFLSAVFFGNTHSDTRTPLR